MGRCRPVAFAHGIEQIIEARIHDAPRFWECVSLPHPVGSGNRCVQTFLFVAADFVETLVDKLLEEVNDFGAGLGIQREKYIGHETDIVQ